MNTTEYGFQFEKQVFEFLKKMLSNDDMPGASAKRSKIFLKKTYPTSTERTITTDVSIETYLNEEKEKAGEWSTLIIFECKRYKNTVDIADLDEFESKLRKIGGFGVKGYFVTTSGFSKTTMQDARKNHYGLAIFGKDGNWNWLVPRDTRRNKSEEYMPIFYGETPVGSSPLFLCNGCFMNLADIFRDADVQIPTTKKLKAPYLPKTTIRKIANDIYLNNPNIDDDIAGHLLFKLFPEFRIIFEKLPFGVEGQASYEDKKIVLSESLLDKPDRMNFTLAHELGHLVLHSDILALYEGINGNQPVPISEQELKWIDVQANNFASAILMPEIKFTNVVKIIFSSLDLKVFPFVIDNQPFKAQLLATILNHISTQFHVSKQAVFIRLKEDGFVSELRKQPKRIGDYLRGY